MKPMPNIEAIFSQEAIKEHSDYFLQTFLYAHIVSSKTPEMVSPCLLFIQHAGSEDYDPTLKIGKEYVIDIASYSDEFMDLLKQLLADMFNAQMAFVPTDEQRRCETCPYASLCRG